MYHHLHFLLPFNVDSISSLSNFQFFVTFNFCNFLFWTAFHLVSFHFLPPFNSKNISTLGIFSFRTALHKIGFHFLPTFNLDNIFSLGNFQFRTAFNADNIQFCTAFNLVRVQSGQKSIWSSFHFWTAFRHYGQLGPTQQPDMQLMQWTFAPWSGDYSKKLTYQKSHVQISLETKWIWGNLIGSLFNRFPAYHNPITIKDKNYPTPERLQFDGSM